MFPQKRRTRLMAVAAASLGPRPHRRLLRRRRAATTTRQRRRHPLGRDHRPDLAHRPRGGRHVRHVRRGVQGRVPRGHRRHGRGPHRLRGRGEDAHEHRELRRRARHPRLGHPRPARRLLRAAGRPGGDGARTYRWINDKSFEGQSYGIPVVGNVQGYRLQQARVGGGRDHRVPRPPPRRSSTTSQAIKDNGVEIAPLYTNYKDGWPLSQWDGWLGAVTADPDWKNEMVESDTPWTEDSDYGVVDGLIYDAVAQGLTEADPTTTNWEESKRLLGTGEVATMVLGSWAIPQMAAAAEAAGASGDDIAYAPTPVQVDGKFHSVAGGDYNLGINVNSENKATARAWIDWFNNESGFSESQAGLSPLDRRCRAGGPRGLRRRGRAHHAEPGARGQGVPVRGHRHRVRHRHDRPEVPPAEHRRRPLRRPHQAADLRRPQRPVGRGSGRRSAEARSHDDRSPRVCADPTTAAAQQSDAARTARKTPGRCGPRHRVVPPADARTTSC